MKGLAGRYAPKWAWSSKLTPVSHLTVLEFNICSKVCKLKMRHLPRKSRRNTRKVGPVDRKNPCHPSFRRTAAENCYSKSFNDESEILLFDEPTILILFKERSIVCHEAVCRREDDDARCDSRMALQKKWRTEYCLFLKMELLQMIHQIKYLTCPLIP